MPHKLGGEKRLRKSRGRKRGPRRGDSVLPSFALDLRVGGWFCWRGHQDLAGSGTDIRIRETRFTGEGRSKRGGDDAISEASYIEKDVSNGRCLGVLADQGDVRVVPDAQTTHSSQVDSLRHLLDI